MSDQQPQEANVPHEEVRSITEEESARRMPGRPPLILPGYTYRSLTEQISSIVLGRTPLGWWAGAFFLFLIVMIFLYAVGYLFYTGVGIWGVNIPIAWGFAIVDFVWWIGIGHAGTLISAILLLMYQSWRTSINRIAEAMTLFAISQAAMFPILHLGRPWLFYWLIPYPSTMNVWPQFRSSLTWDVFAITTYFIVSLIFWYMGALPDFGTMRDRAKRRIPQVLFGIVALGWRGSIKHWRNYQMAYLIIAALATPLVVSVHSVVSLDFTISIVPGWHSTIFPPYFVAGALLSGFAMVLTLVIPIRSFYRLHGLITDRYIENMARWMLVTALVVDYSYATELFMSWYSGDVFEEYMSITRMFGAYWWVWWSVMMCNVVVPQALWFRGVRRNVMAVFFVAMFINVGMWIERFMIIVVSLSRDFLPSSWEQYAGTVWDWATFIGTLGVFAWLMFLFVRLVPMISMSESKELLSEQELTAGTHA